MLILAMLNKLRCHTHFFSQPDCLIQVDTNSHTMINSADPDQLASEKPTDLDLHCMQRQGIFGFGWTRVNNI